MHTKLTLGSTLWSVLLAMMLWTTAHEAPAQENAQRVGFAARISGILQTTQGAKHVSEKGDVTAGSLFGDLELSAALSSGASGLVLLEVAAESRIDKHVPSFSAFNDLAEEDPTAHLAEAWIEQRWWDERAAAKVGLVDLKSGSGRNESAFDGNAVANDAATQFLSSGFVNSLAVEFPEDNGLGFTLWLSAVDWLDFGFGLTDAQDYWERPFAHLFLIAQMDFHYSLGDLPGTYRFFTWRNNSDHERL